MRMPVFFLLTVVFGVGCAGSRSFHEKEYAPVEPAETGTIPEQVFTPREVDEQARPIGGLPGLQPRIIYPEEARRAGVGGVVMVRLIMNARGEVVRAEIARSAHPVLDRSAMDAIPHHRFTSGVKDGRLVAMVLEMPVTFATNRRS